MQIADWIRELAKSAYRIQTEDFSVTDYTIECDSPEEYEKLASSLPMDAKVGESTGIVTFSLNDAAKKIYITVSHKGTYDDGKALLDSIIQHIVSTAASSIKISKTAEGEKEAKEYPTQKKIREEVTLEKGYTAADFSTKKVFDKKEIGNPSVKSNFPEGPKGETDALIEQDAKAPKESPKFEGKVGETTAVIAPCKIEPLILEKMDFDAAKGTHIVDLSKDKMVTYRGKPGHISLNIDEEKMSKASAIDAISKHAMQTTVVSFNIDDEIKKEHKDLLGKYADNQYLKLDVTYSYNLTSTWAPEGNISILEDVTPIDADVVKKSAEGEAIESVEPITAAKIVEEIWGDDAVENQIRENTEESAKHLPEYSHDELVKRQDLFNLILIKTSENRYSLARYPKGFKHAGLILAKNITLEEGNSLYTQELQKLCEATKKFNVQLFVSGDLSAIAALLLKFRRTKDVELRDGYIQFTTYDSSKESVITNTELVISEHFKDAQISNIVVNEISAGE